MANPNPNTNNTPWPEKDELGLLKGVLEMTVEPAEEHNLRIDMFHRISRHLNKSLPNLEVLGKVEELRKSYEKKWCQIHYNKTDVKKTPVFLMSEKIWGGGIQKRMKKAMMKKKRMKKAMMKKKEAQRIAQAKAGIVKAAIVKSADKRKRDDNPAPKRKKQKAEGTCFVCGKHGHFTRVCPQQKKPMKQQGTEEISKGTVELQVETEDEHEEMFNELVVSSIKLDTDQMTSEQTQQISHIANRSNPDANQLASKDEPTKTGYGAKDKQQNDEVPCFSCGKYGHFANACTEQKIVKQPIKQQETEKDSKANVGSQLETENKCGESSGELVIASIEPGSNELAPEQTQHKHQVPSYKKADDSNTAKSGPHLHTSDAIRIQAQSKFKSEARQNNLNNRFRPNVHQQNLRHDSRRSPAPPIFPHPRNWWPRPGLVTPPMYAQPMYAPRPPPHMPYPFLPPRPPMFYPRPPPPDPMNRSFPPNYRHFSQ